MSYNIKPGVATGKDVQEIFKLAKAKKFALPAVNVMVERYSMQVRDCLTTVKKLQLQVV